MATNSALAETAAANGAVETAGVEDQFLAFMSTQDNTLASSESTPAGPVASEAAKSTDMVRIGAEEYTPSQATALVAGGKLVVQDIQAFGQDSVQWRNEAFAIDAQHYQSLEVIKERNLMGDLFLAFGDEDREAILEYAQMRQDGKIPENKSTLAPVLPFTPSQDYVRQTDMRAWSDEGQTIWEMTVAAMTEVNDRVLKVAKAQLALKDHIDPLFQVQQDEHTARALRIHLGQGVTAEHVRTWREQDGITEPLANNAAALKALLKSRAKAPEAKQPPEPTGNTASSETFNASLNSPLTVEQQLAEFRAGKKMVV